MRCDLHVHTSGSGMCTVPVARRFCRESYNEPLALYEVLKGRGMDLVTVTDHDSIDAVEPLRHFPDFFLSEEVTCIMPSGNEAHIGVYDITERDHLELQRRRDDIISFAGYCQERGILCAVNHVFSALTGARAQADFSYFRDLFPAFETVNGHILPSCNRRAETLSAQWRKIPLGGSDAHTLAELGRAFTEAPGARTKREYLEALKAGHVRARGLSGGFRVCTRAVWTIASNIPREHKWALLAAPVLLAVPFATLGSTLRDGWFAASWSRRVQLTSPAWAPQEPCPAGVSESF
ncbi:MAG: PHP domain-containing protein [Acidobacteriia bacterium]|nr:PHP domain-containing protein [Terriglobia bacterium]